MSRRVDLPLVAAIVSVGIAARLTPLSRSPLPYNTDGFVFARSAERVLAADGALLGVAAPDSSLFVALSAAASEVTGVAPLFLLQAVVACLSVVVPLVAAAYASSLAAGLSGASRRGAAAFAGLGLSLVGPYLFRTMSVNAEVYGIALLFSLLLALDRAFRTGARVWLGLSVALAAAMPFAHNLSALFAGLVGTTLVALALARRATVRRVAAASAGVAAFWLLTFGYYEAVGLPKAGAVSASLGLFVAWLVVVVALARWLDTASPAVQRGAPVVALAGCTAVLVGNAAVSVYPGTATTSPTLLVLTLPLTVLAVPVALGAPQLADSDPLGAFAALVGPFAAVGFALTAGSTPLYLDLLLRSATFVFPGLFVAAAVGLAWLARRRPGVGTALSVVVVVAVVASAPLPFAGLAAFPFEPVTETDEFEAATFAADHTERWATDEHLALVANNYGPGGASVAPTTAWLRGDAGPPDCPTLARASWTTVGAPTGTGPSRLSRPVYEGWSVNASVVYAGGAHDRTVLGWAPGSCAGGVVP